ncbi:MAG: Rne/Rng family ribonuclease [Melioribacteraceae bacterium]|nr:Rne/Rng family ribonuclease [Melioribacteraceae bacterium]
MNKEIIINSSASQNRVAITEDSKLVDFFVDHPEKQKMVGDIYFGKVARVLPGIRAAFIDIGLKHDAFLHFSDIDERLNELQTIFEDDSDDEDDSSRNQQDSQNQQQPQSQNQSHQPQHRSSYHLKKGEEILVQIIKEPVKDKGVRVTSAISLPGRFCVLLPFDNKIGVSKKISDYREKRRLKKLARSILPENCGLIIRTAANAQTEEALSADLKYLINAWEEIQESVKLKSPPALVYKDLSTTTSVIRDLFTKDVSKVFIDSKKLYKEIRSYVKFVQPELSEKIEYYKGKQAIFETFRIEEQIAKMMSRKVPLPSGGHIVFDHTEAMIVVDVNSGRYAAKKEQELNSLKTDLEAAREIALQLKLRDIGGLIVIDFIDLEDERNRKKIYDELRKEFKKDRAKIALLPMTEFGIIQMTRQRVRENILQSMTEVCPYCEGSGLLTKKSNLIHEIDEWFKKIRLRKWRSSITLKVHPSLGKSLKEGKISMLTKLQFKYRFRIKLIEDEQLNPQTFQILSTKTGEDLTEEI